MPISTGILTPFITASSERNILDVNSDDLVA
jgi:hypothetical protein